MNDIKSAERSNFYRLSLLILDVGTPTLHYLFKKEYSSIGTLQTFLQSKHGVLNKLFAKNVIKQKQQKLLQPATGIPLVEDFDISLVSTLLTNLCSIAKPQNGWTSPLAANDWSAGADILRLREARNELFAHRVNGGITKVVFEQAWKDVSAAVTRLSKQLCKNEEEDIQKKIEEVKIANISWERDNQINGLLFDRRLGEIWDKLLEIKPDRLMVITPEQEEDLLFLFLQIPKDEDGIISILKQYPNLKSNLTKGTQKAIAERLLDEKLISKDVYERITDFSCERRHYIDRLLKKVIIHSEPKVRECFFNELKTEYPKLAISLSEMEVTEKDRIDYKEVGESFVDDSLDEIMSDHNINDIKFIQFLLRDSPEVVDKINDELLSSFLINTGEHSKIIQSLGVDDMIHNLFVTLLSHHLPVEPVLQKNLEPEAFKKWLEFRKCKYHQMVLQLCLPTLERDLNFSRVFFHVCQKKLLNESSIQSISREVTELGQTRLLLRFLQQRQSSIYEHFKDCLILSGHLELKDLLEREETRISQQTITHGPCLRDAEIICKQGVCASKNTVDLVCGPRHMDVPRPVCVTENIKMQNFCRFYLLLTEVGTQVLQLGFNKHSSSSGDIETFMECERVKIDKLLKQQIITKRQRDLLKTGFSVSPSFHDLDVRLLSILLINLCKITKPLGGWMAQPDRSDISTGADIIRLVIARKELYDQCTEGGLIDSYFQVAWDTISQSIVRLVGQFDPNKQEDFQNKIAAVCGKQISITMEREINRQIMKQMLSDRDPAAASDQIILADEEDHPNTDTKSFGSLQSLLHWLQALPVSFLKYIFCPRRFIFKRKDLGSVILIFFAGEDFTVQDLKPNSVATKLRKLLTIGCFQSETQLKNPVHVTVSILSPGNGDPDEIHFCIDFERTDGTTSKEVTVKHEAKLKAEEIKLMIEEMDPTPLQHWIFEQLQINSDTKHKFNDIGLWNDMTRQEKMEFLLESIGEFDNGYDMLAEYCEENEAYVFNKVFEKTPIEKEQKVDHESILSYRKGDGHQELYSMWIDMDGDQGIDEKNSDIKTEEASLVEVKRNMEETEVLENKDEEVEKKKTLKISDTEMGLWNAVKPRFGVNDQPAQPASQPPPHVIYRDVVMQKPRPPQSLLVWIGFALDSCVTAIRTIVRNLLAVESDSRKINTDVDIDFPSHGDIKSTTDLHFVMPRRIHHFKSLEALKEKIKQYTPPPNVEVHQARILMIGQIGAGKSSFFNTINSIFSDRITHISPCGSTDRSFTTVYRQYQIRPKGNSETLKFCLCDTCGIEESEGPSLGDIKYLLDGNVPNGYQFNWSSPINPSIRGFIKRPGLADQVHCVVFVLDATVVDVMSDAMWNKFKQMQVEVSQRGIPRVILLTKIDKLSKDVQDDVSEAFECREVYEAVEKVSAILGIQRHSIHPIKNYEDEMELNDEVSCLALTALEQILAFANDFLDDRSSLLSNIKAWRQPTPHLSRENLLTLMDKIENHSPPTDLGIPFTRILMIGPIGAGKSSFVNSIYSTFRGRISQQSMSGSSQRSLTTEYRQYKIKGRMTDEYLKFRLCDTCGIEDNQGPDLAELMFLIEGNVPDGYRFNPSAPITQDIPGFINNPGLKNMVHCVVFVFDATAVAIIAEPTWEKLNQLQIRMNNKGIPRAVLLTKIDQFSIPLGDDVSKVFHSEEVQKAVDLVSQKLGIEQNKIYPIKNYEKETDLNDKISNLSLLALNHILEFANDFLSRQENTMSNKYSYMFLLFALLVVLVALVIFFLNTL